jgi:23S rRNA (adenine2503-C2)-methyltransferase
VARLRGRRRHALALRRALLRRGAADLAELARRAGAGAQLPRGLAESLGGEGVVAMETRVASERAAADGSTKLLVALADGHGVECVVMPAGKGCASLCVSSQVGCPVGCPFCASGIGGLARNLAAHEILEQFAHARARADVRRAVVMGVGEPLLNYDAVMEALGVVADEGGLAETRLVISSVGFPERVRRLARSGRRFGLAISLHAVSDELREKLVPGMRGVRVREVVTAAAEWAAATGGRVQFEYVALRGVNDDLSASDELARLLRGLPAYVNFIAWNEVPELPFQRPDEARLEALVRRARALGLVATRRRTLGAEVTAACGQLRRGLSAWTAAPRP